MRIAVDVRELCGRPTGVGRYLGEVLHEWAEGSEAARHEWDLYAHERAALPPAFADRMRVLPGAGGTRWEQWTLARALAADRPDVLFAPGYTAPLTAPCPTAVTVHDVSFSAHPEWFSAREGLRRRVLTSWSARRARAVLTVSEFSKQEIVRFAGIPESRIRVIPHGQRSLPSHAGGPREPMVLYVGSLFTRRNIGPLSRAFASRVLRAVPDATLMLVGENRMHPPMDFDDLARQSGGRIAVRSYVAEDELVRLYGAASAFAFLSEYEGFGLTPLEALAAGVPPIVLDTAVAREIYGPAARYVPATPPLEPAIGAALIEMLTSQEARASLLRQAPEVLRRYRWDRAAADTLRAIEEAGGG